MWVPEEQLGQNWANMPLKCRKCHFRDLRTQKLPEGCVPAPSRNFLLHARRSPLSVNSSLSFGCTTGLDIKACIHTITSPQPMALVGNTYSSIMPGWITKFFFCPELEIHILGEHSYCDDSEVRSMRTMENLHLVKFIEL